jgi:hypothetical protein
MSGNKAKGPVKGITAALDAVSDGLFGPSTPSTGTLPKKKGANNSTTVVSVSTSNQFETLSTVDSSEFIENLGGPKSSSLDDKVDFLIDLYKKQMLKSEEHSATIKQLVAKNTTLEKECASMKKELRYAKETINRMELASRSLSIRVLGLPVSQEESASPGEANRIATKAAYDKIFKPIWAAAKSKGTISTVPQLNTAVESGYRLRSFAKDKRGNPLPPPLVVHFSTKVYRTELFKNKREAMPNIMETEGWSNIFVVEELTAPTIKRMKELREDDRVERVWSVEGTIRFSLKSDHKPRTCFNVFGPLAEIIK